MTVRIVSEPAPGWRPPGTAVGIETYTIDVVTPLFGGGAEPRACDPDYPVRPTAVRGHLRFWWRALVGGRYASATDLAAAETAIWGNDEDPGRAAVSVRILSAGESVEVFSWTRNGKVLKFPDTAPAADRWPRYALHPFQGTCAAESAKAQVGVKFELRLSLASLGAQQAEEVRRAVRAWAAYGGLGARTRRGCGSLRIVAGGGGAAQAKSVESARLTDARIPLLSGSALVEGAPVRDAVAAWKKAVALYQDFRQLPPFARNPGQGPRPGRSRWPEPNSIRRSFQGRNWYHKPDEGSNLFPRADLGLPIVFHFNGMEHIEPDDTTLQPAEPGATRMASPAITKAYMDARGEWRPLILMLNAPHAWDEGDLVLVGTNERPGRAQVEIPDGRKVGPITGPIREALLDFAVREWKSSREVIP